MAKAEKVIILGVDGLDPRATRYYMDQGKLPNIQKIVERGAGREDLVLLGNMPTITPPMWTTLATGAFPITHGITCFWNQDPEHLDTMVYSLDSRECKAEPLWNVFAEEAGKKTLVWHWPGSSWPPTSESENLHVVDGTQPGAVNMGIAPLEGEKLVVASKEITEVGFKPKTKISSGAGCIIDDLDADALGGEKDGAAKNKGTSQVSSNAKHVTNIMLSHEDGELALDVRSFDISNSPIKNASGWVDAPADALEFVMVIHDGLERRNCLIVKNADGIYDTIRIYANKKTAEPIVELHKGQMTFAVPEVIKVDGKPMEAVRNYQILDLAEDGSYVRIWASIAFDAHCDAVWHPKTLFQEVKDNVGIVPPNTGTGGGNIDFVEKILLPCWDNYTRWQGEALNYLLANDGYEVIFSHLHNVDGIGHSILHYCTEHEGRDNALVGRYQAAWERVYVQTDEYLGQFVHLLDEGWTIFVTSDHGLVLSNEEVPLLGDPFGVNVGVLEALGYTAVVKDSDGKPTKEIDWSKTRAIATRGNHIWLNLKGRDANGIVDPADKYDLERQIIDDLYGFRLDGKRIVSIALRNQDAQILGMGGPGCGDILYWLEENHTRVHGDVLSTFQGCNHSSVSPIFIAAGQGIKQGYRTERVIQEVDVAPTIAACMGVRMPAECEGGPVFQILED